MTSRFVKKTIDHEIQPIPGLNMSPPFPSQYDSDKVLELTGYWTPPVPPWKPMKNTLNSSLRIACVVEDRLYRGLRFEGQVLLLTPGNWKNVLKHGKPDFLLMESTWITATGHWRMSQSPNAPARDELLEIVSFARKLSIPTVFWITKGHEYHAHYKDFARYFEFVFSADPRETEQLRTEGIRAEVLLPCVQPALYNPFRHFEYYDTFRLGILYDGWADLDRMTDDLSVLNEVKPYGLSIIESRYQIFRQRMEMLPDYKDCILGCISEQSRVLTLKYAKAYITLDQSLSTKTTQQWMTLEATASRLPVIHHGTLPDTDVRKGVVVECPERLKFLAECVRFQEDDLYRERIAHLGWRKTCQNHSFAHRLKEICATIGINHDWVEYPKASLITPTFRREYLPRCFETYEQQSYPNKELILVFNGHEVPSYSELGLDSPRDDVKISCVPGDMFTGACLNQGCALSDGEFCLKIDDDDHYGQSYVLDMLLQARCIDADFFGKPPSPIYFEDDQKVYVRIPFYPLSILSNNISKNLLKSGKQWMGGNSICGKTDFFKKNYFADYAFGAADTASLFNMSEGYKPHFAIMDFLNLVAERRDNSMHTWKIDSEKLKNKCMYSCDHINSTIV